MAYGRIAPAHVLSTQESMTEASVLQVRAAEYVCGALLLDECGHGRVRPQRLLASQHLALTSCLAWYPGIFKQLAPCCAGVRVEFETDAQYVELELELDSEPKPTANVLAQQRPQR